MKRFIALCLIAALANLPGAALCAPASLTVSTATVMVDTEGVVVSPAGRMLPQQFTGATRAATVPLAVGAMGWETDTGVVYLATGDEAGDWSASGATIPDASTTTAGKVELATLAETAAGTDATRAVTPGGLQAVLADEDSGFRIEDNGGGGMRLMLWNETQAVYQEVRLAGASGAERLIIVD